jgi:hypothetical protein
MMRGLLLIPAFALGGCISTVGRVVTAPVKVAGKAVDWTTTSRDEADRFLAGISWDATWRRMRDQIDEAVRAGQRRASRRTTGVAAAVPGAATPATTERRSDGVRRKAMAKHG